MFEQIGHAKSSSLVGHDGDDARTQILVLEQGAEHTNKGHGGTHLFAVSFEGELRIAFDHWHRHYGACCLSPRYGSAKCRTMLAQITHLRAIVVGPEEFQSFSLLIGKRKIESISEFDQLGFIKLLLTVRGHLALAC